jgi:hypothetical protein
MGLARLLLNLALVACVAPVADSAADQAGHCRATIVQRGTTLFATTAEVVARCTRRQLRTGDLSESCPADDEFTRIADLTTTAFTAIEAGCGPVTSLFLCLDSGNGEALQLPLDVIRVVPEPARGAKLRCLDTMSRQTVRQAEFEARQLGQCNIKVASGTAGYGPAGPTCDGPSGAQAKIAAARIRTTAKIERACGGPDGAAGTADDLDPQTDLGFGASCTGSPYCESTIDTLPELIACAGCIAKEEVGQLSRGLADLPLDAVEACDVGKHQAVLSLVADDLRDLSACEKRILDGHEAGPCPNGETSDDVFVNMARYDGRIAEACAGSGPSSTTIADLASVLITALYPVHAEEPDNDLKRCKVEIASSATSSSSYARRKLNAMRACTVQLACGQTTAPCPDSEATASIQRGAISAADDIHDRCDAYTPSQLGYGPTCPSEGACGALPTTTIGELIACLQCVGDEVIDAAVALAL